MCAMYDEKNKLWGSFDEKPMIDLSMSLGQWILKRLTAHGSNVAQVFRAISEFWNQNSIRP